MKGAAESSDICFARAGAERSLCASEGGSEAGNLTADSSHSYAWDAEGRLKSVDSGSGVAQSLCF